MGWLSAGDHQDQVAALHLLHIGERDPLDHSIDWCSDRRFHLHRLDGRHGGTRLDLIALPHSYSDDPGERRGDMAGIVWIRALSSFDIDLDRLVSNSDRS